MQNYLSIKLTCSGRKKQLGLNGKDLREDMQSPQVELGIRVHCFIPGKCYEVDLQCQNNTSEQLSICLITTTCMPQKCINIIIKINHNSDRLRNR